MYKALAKAAEQRTAEAESEVITAIGAMARYKLMAEGLHGVATDAIELMRRMALATDARLKPGIYFLLDVDGDVVYVGQAVNVLFRMAGHAEKEFAAVRMIEVWTQADRDRLERLYIQFLTPRYNVALTAHNNVQRRMSELEALMRPAPIPSPA